MGTHVATVRMQVVSVQENLLIARKTFDLPDQIREPGSLSWCKTVKINPPLLAHVY